MAVRIVPSVLPVDFAHLGEAVARLDAAGADRLQWDAMDGQFVPNLTFGPDVIAAARPHAGCGFEAHLMCERPEELFERYVDAGCELIIVHPESLRQPHAALRQIRELGAGAGLALSPGTPVAFAEPVLDLLDLVLVMTVNPGFGGQPYLVSMEAKVARTRELIDGSGREIALEVDGGIGPDTIAGAAAAGADVFVAGTSLWRAASLAEGIEDLRARAEAARTAR
ncbi:ribulose-phosphate 3-epimerase [Egibacter rhizosphaerae]|uniref:ribulose-phosphate 3-epimerase n=1 Tax=Egibacter rhizosphaerae TaxID=1670831 RepID=UPI00197AA201|nr:ribulose-phosphate 3-epimerase [Egibacter rhizosphaerae]